MASDDSDVSAITLSDDDGPKQKVPAPLQPSSKTSGRAVGSSRAAVTGAGGASKPGRQEGKRKARVSFLIEDDKEVEGYDDRGRDAKGSGRTRGSSDGSEGADEDGAVQDETKPLGWSYFQKRDASEGPATWGEVDVSELQFVAENLVRSTTKRASQADEVIQQIFQTAQCDEDSLVPDPLGRGVIDPVTLTLGKRSKMQAARQAQPISGEKGLKATMRTFRTARLGAAQQQQQQAISENAGGSQQAASAAAGSGLDEESRKVLPNQEGFDPEAYLATFHSESSMNQLEKGLRSLSRELSERTGQLKLLIRNNFDRFINCKDAIDDIHAKMRKTLVRGGAGGPVASSGAASGSTPVTAPPAAAQQQQQQQQQTVATDKVFRSLEQVELQARRTFGPILDRAAKADRIRAVANLLQRFDHLFAAPQRIMELASRGELEQVVREYKRANMLIRPTPTTARVWVSLYTEIEKRVTEVFLAVRQLVTEPPPEGRPMELGGSMASTDTASGDDAARQRLSLLPDYLLFLALVRQERLPAAREEDAMRLYVTRLETHVTARIQACDRQHTEQLGQLVTGWMRATMGTGGSGGGAGGGSSSTAPSGAAAALRAASTGVASLQASLTTLSRLDAPGPGPPENTVAGGKIQGETGGPAASGPDSRSQAQGRSGDGDGTGSDPDLLDADDDLDEEGEAAEAVFLQWQGGLMGVPSTVFAGNAASLPYYIHAELRRIVQEPGGPYGVGGLYGGGGVGASGRGGAVEPLPSSAFAPVPNMTSAQRQWVSYVCSISALLLWSIPGLWATCNSPKYGNNADLTDEARESLDRGPSLGRRLVENLCIKYATRLRRAAQSLARAGPMQPGLPLIIKDACHLWSSLRRMGIGTRMLSSLRRGALAAMAAHVRVLESHLAELPQQLFGADDFRLDLLAADHQPVTSLPRRLEEELGVALLHYQWPLEAVAEAAGGVSEVSAESGWRPMQGSVFACFSLLSEALAEYAKSLYSSQPEGGKDTRSSLMSKASSSLSAELESASSTTLTGTPASTTPLGQGSRQGAGAAGAMGSSPGPGPLRRAAELPWEGAVEGEGRTHGSLWSATGGGCGSNDDVRVLLVIGNSAVIRTRVMPGVVERYRKLLAPTPEASLACQRRLRELTSAMRRSNEALGSSYLGRKEADVQAAVQGYIAAATAPLLPTNSVSAVAVTGAAAGVGVGVGGSSGVAKRRSKGEATTRAGLLPGPSGPSTGCCVLLQLLTAIHNEALAYSPSNLRSFMEALAERLVGDLVLACRGLMSAGKVAVAAASSAATAGATTVEQLVQLWADLRFLSAVLRPLLTEPLAGDLQVSKVAVGTAISARQAGHRYRPASEPAAALMDLSDGGAVNGALEELLAADVDAWLQLHALNVRCFAGAVAPAPAAAAAAAATANPSQGPGAGGTADGVTSKGDRVGKSNKSSSASSPRGRGEQRERAEEGMGSRQPQQTPQQTPAESERAGSRASGDEKVKERIKRNYSRDNAAR